MNIWTDITRLVVLVDIDGTLARVDGRLHHIADVNTGIKLPVAERNWDAFHKAGCEAEPFSHVVALVQTLHDSNFYIHIYSGRSDQYRCETQQWLINHWIGCSALTMRGEKDFRSSVDYKADIFALYPPAAVLMILEDQEEVVKKARWMGYTCFHVHERAF